jgi:hypothetical protein
MTTSNGVDNVLAGQPEGSRALPARPFGEDLPPVGVAVFLRQREGDRPRSSRKRGSWLARHQGEKLTLSLTPAFTAQYQEVAGECLDPLFSPTLFEELAWELNASTGFRQEFSVLFPVNGDADPSWHSSLALKRRLTDVLSLNVLYIYDYDGTLPTGTEASQQSLNLMLGASF